LAQKEKKILFVCHIASRSGAPLLLLEIIKAFKKNNTTPFNILLVKNGELAPEFKALGNTLHWHAFNSKPPASLAGRLVNMMNRFLQALHQRYIVYQLRHTSLVLLNTLSNGDVMQKLLHLPARFICYVHEMNAAIHIITTPKPLQVLLNNTHTFIACSHAVKNNLVTHHRVNSNKIKVLATPLLNVYRQKKMYEVFINDFKKVNYIDNNACIIGVVGNNEWRKGFDFFLPLVMLYFNLYPQSKALFVWKGFTFDKPSSFFDEYDVEKFSLQEKILLLTHGSDSIETMACFDVHLLLSREDPYPLVVLEAATLAIPTICFANAGGSPEFIENDSGFCVPYPNLLLMANQLHQLVQHSELRNTMGLKAQQKVQARHTVENTMPAFMQLLANGQ
jgi:glycosyltransferase involved in cell wall biosynthesis